MLVWTWHHVRRRFPALSFSHSFRGRTNNACKDGSACETARCRISVIAPRCGFRNRRRARSTSFQVPGSRPPAQRARNGANGNRRHGGRRGPSSTGGSTSGPRSPTATCSSMHRDGRRARTASRICSGGMPPPRPKPFPRSGPGGHPHVIRHGSATATPHAAGDIRKVSIRLGHANVRTAETHVHASQAERPGILAAVAPPSVRHGTFTGVGDSPMEMPNGGHTSDMMPSRNKRQPLAARGLKHPAWHCNMLGITAIIQSHALWPRRLVLEPHVHAGRVRALRQRCDRNCAETAAEPLPGLRIGPGMKGPRRKPTEPQCPHQAANRLTGHHNVKDFLDPVPD